MRKTTVYALLTLKLLVSQAAIAEIYRSVDEKGDVKFSDSPDKKSEKIELPPTNTQQFDKPTPYTPASKATDPDYDKVGITSPHDGETIPPGVTTINVSVSTAPTLHSEHKIVILLDGSPSGTAQHTSSFTLGNLYRGEHRLQAQIVDPQGKEIRTSEPVIIFVKRSSN